MTNLQPTFHWLTTILTQSALMSATWVGMVTMLPAAGVRTISDIIRIRSSFLMVAGDGGPATDAMLV